MPLVNGKKLIKIIQERKVIAGAFNTTNLETTLGILEAIEKSGIPSFIQIAPTNIGIMSYDELYRFVKVHARNMDTPVTLHLDHGKKLEDFKKACRAGFGSVMIDGSRFDFEGNIEFTKRGVDFAGMYDIAVEAELGAIMGKEDDHVLESECKTDPGQIIEFVERTGCDYLAVSVGNVHGLAENPKIDFELLKKISEESPVPLVIHGGSGIPNSQVMEMIKFNVVKMNIASDLRNAYLKSIAEKIEHDDKYSNLIAALKDAKEAVTSVVYEKINSMNGIKNER